MLNKIIISFLLILAVNANAKRADDHAPASIMGEHNHNKGEIMLSYRFMQMNMENIYLGDKKIAAAPLMMKPIKMKMKMHMFGAMYGLNSKNTLMLMLPYNENKMSMKNQMSQEISKMQSEGIGDIKISSILSLSKNKKLNIGLSLPTGNIKKASNNGRLPYKMQLGTGTYDPFIAYKNVKYFNSSSLGYQLKAKFNIHKNSEDYSYGNKYQLSLWYAKLLSNNFSLSSSLEFAKEEAIEGSDKAIENPSMSISRNSSNSGSENIYAKIGFNKILSNKNNKSLRFSAEYKKPLYQKYKNYQMGEADNIIFSIQKEL
jgi:hypothetical protein